MAATNAVRYRRGQHPAGFHGKVRPIPTSPTTYEIWLNPRRRPARPHRLLARTYDKSFARRQYYLALRTMRRGRLSFVRVVGNKREELEAVSVGSR